MANESLSNLRAVDKSARPVSPSDDSPSETTNLELINQIWNATSEVSDALTALSELFHEKDDTDFNTGIAVILRGLSERLISCNWDAHALKRKIEGGES